MQKKYYKAFHFTALGIILYILTVPFWSSMMNKVVPGITKCPFLAISGKPCPFCGMTRYISSIWEHGFYADVLQNPVFLTLVIFLIMNVLFRVAALCVGYKKPIVWVDGLLSGMLVLTGVAYIALYFLK